MDPRFPNASNAPASSPPATPAWPRAPRALASSRGLDWWSEGWRVFMAAPALWIGVVVVLVLIMAALSFVPFAGNVAQFLLWPVFSGGLVLGCHALAHGRPLEFGHLFAGFQEGRAGGLVILGLISLGVNLVLMLVVAMFVFGAVGVSGLAGFMSGDPTAMVGSALAGAGVAALIATPIVLIAGALFLMAWWFATPLVVLNRAQPVEALKASFDAAWRNIGALAIFGLVFLGLAIVASIPFGLGWLVLGPVSVGASYASWREVFGE
jgi:uncharacterized membrane protein